MHEPRYQGMYSDGAPKDVLRSILNGKLVHAVDASAFANDTVFCEWAYFIDFAEGRIDVHVDGSSEVLDSRSFAEASEEWMEELSIAHQMANEQMEREMAARCRA